MAESTGDPIMAETTDDDPTMVAPDELNFDPRNPRLPHAETPSEQEAIEALVVEADVSELVQSIAHSGWLDFEPLIVLENGNVVLEGNRRLAALRIISRPEYQKFFGVQVPAELHPKAIPAKIRVAFVSDKNEAREFIGFKHVNGPHKWDSAAKARFAWEWLEEDHDVTLGDVARRLGDGHNTVARLVNGYVVLEQARDIGFDDEQRTSARFAFSHLYTILARPSARDWLGLAAPVNELLPKNPVDQEHRDNLLKLMSWLYGQGDDRSVIKSQNPNLNQLADVLGNKTATAMLASERDLAVAYAQVEDRNRRFSELLFALQGAARDAAASVGDYEHDPDLLSLAEGVQRTVRSIVASMNAAKEDDAVMATDDGSRRA